MIAPYAVMVNILGKRKGEANVDHAERLLATANAHIHIYGKSYSKIGRKMGHITVLGHDPDEAFDKAKSLENEIIL